jgi:Ca-activated chloride channel homolog
MRYLLFVLLLAIGSFLSFNSPANFTVTGKVVDDYGSPISGATVNEKGKKNATITDANGAFSLVVSSDKAVLVISYIGYNVQQISLKGRAQLNISLKASTQNLQEVVVTGYGTTKKKNITGSVVTINPGYSSPSTVPAPNQALAGKASGIMITNGNGRREAKRYDKIASGSDRDFNTEDYDAIVENKFLNVTENPLSTFSIDVDAASYSNVRRYLQNNQLPPTGAVRSEELINYFHYEYPQPTGNDPFSINTEMADCAWNKEHKLVLIGLQGKKIPVENLPASNLVFLIDVSGSMQDENKLPLVRASMKMLVDQLREQDRVSMVVYAGSAGLVLSPTSGSEKTKITEAIDRLEAGGSTAGGAGIQLAYETARKNFVKEGNNRVILCTDGDFNVGASSNAALEDMIEKERKSGVFLTVLGYGMGNYKDNKMQKLADSGNGNHAYIDGILEAKKVLVNEFGGTLFTIAKDVKLQLEFNPANVQAYRLIGYENRLLNKEDFNNDQKDAGELGSGHTVTALYEVIPVGVKNVFQQNTDALKYQKQTAGNNNATGEILTVKFRYKQPDGDVSKLITHTVPNKTTPWKNATENFRFAASVAQFGMLLNNSSFKQSASYDNVWKLAKDAIGKDREGYRSEFLKLVRTAQSLAKEARPIEEEEDVSSK